MAKKRAKRVVRASTKSGTIRRPTVKKAVKTVKRRRASKKK